MQCILKNTCKHKVKRISLSPSVPQTPLSLCSDDYWDWHSKWSTVMRCVRKCVFLCVSHDAPRLGTKSFICNLRYLIWFYSDQDKKKTDAAMTLLQKSKNPILQSNYTAYITEWYQIHKSFAMYGHILHKNAHFIFHSYLPYKDVIYQIWLSIPNVSIGKHKILTNFKLNHICKTMNV